MVSCLSEMGAKRGHLALHKGSRLFPHDLKQVVLSQGTGAESRIDPETEFTRAKQRNHANAIFDRPSNGYSTG